jgi:hypothetical protein
MKPKWQQALGVGAVAMAIAFAAGCGGDMSNQSPRAAAAKIISLDSVGDNDVVLDVQGMV